MSTDDVLNQFDSICLELLKLGTDLNLQGADKEIAISWCPNHNAGDDDESSRLVVHRQDDSNVIHCAGGCNGHQVLHALGVKTDDKWTEMVEQVLLDDAVKQEAHKLKIRELAKEKWAAEKRPPLEPYDAGTLGEILARPPLPKARIEDLVPWEAGTLIVGQRKVGKTTFNGNLCRSLIKGGPFLGRFQVQPLVGNVAILNFEMPAQTLASWYSVMQIPYDRLHIMNLRGRTNPLGTEEERAKLAQWFRDRDIEAVIFDPFGRAYTGKSQNDPGEVGAWLADLDRLTRGAGVKDIFLPAHAGWDGERTRGASALEDWADSIITLTSDNGDRYVRAIGRDVDLEEDQIRFHKNERYLELARTGTRKATAEKRHNDALRVVIIAIVTDKPGINGSEIAAELKDNGVPHQRDEHRPILNALVSEGKFTIEPGPRGAKKYSVASSPPPGS
jgi:AAA domain